MTKARDIADFKFEDIVDTGTEGTKVASGTTAQRGSTAGQFRYNSTLGLFEGTNGSEFKLLDVAPTVTAFSASNFESSALPQNITITGTNFSIGATVDFVDASNVSIASPTVTRNSSTELVAQIPNTVLSDNEPFKVRVTNASGLNTTSTLEFNIDASPVFGQASGSLGSVNDLASGTHFTLTATDDEGDAVTFSETTNNLTNAGLTLNSDGTITGDVTDVISETVTSFTARASDGTNTTDRNFSITTTLGRNGTSSARSAIGGAEILDINPSATNGTYYLDPYYSGSQTSFYNTVSDGTYTNPDTYTIDMSNGGWTSVNFSNLNTSNFIRPDSNLASVSGGKYFKSGQGGNVNSPNFILNDQKLLGRYEFMIGHQNIDVTFDSSSVWGFAGFHLIPEINFRKNNSSPLVSVTSLNSDFGTTQSGMFQFSFIQNNSNNYGWVYVNHWNGANVNDYLRQDTSMGTDTQRFKIENGIFSWYRNGSLQATRNVSTYGGTGNEKYFIWITLQDSFNGQETYINLQDLKVKNN